MEKVQGDVNVCKIHIRPTPRTPGSVMIVTNLEIVSHPSQTLPTPLSFQKVADS